MAELKPFTALLASLLAGILVSGHLIDPVNRQPVQDLLDTFFGGLIVLGTVAAAIHRYVIPHDKVTQTTTTATIDQTTVATPETSVNNQVPITEPVATVPAG